VQAIAFVDVLQYRQIAPGTSHVGGANFATLDFGKVWKSEAGSGP